MPQVQITEIEFDLDTLDIIQQPNMKESLQEEYVGQIYDLDMCCYDEVNDESVLLDANHPLAGKNLIFDLEVVSID